MIVGLGKEGERGHVNVVYCAQLPAIGYRGRMH